MKSCQGNVIKTDNMTSFYLDVSWYSESGFFFQISNKVIDEWRSEKIKAFFNAGLLEMLNSTDKTQH